MQQTQLSLIGLCRSLRDLPKVEVKETKEHDPDEFLIFKLLTNKGYERLYYRINKNKNHGIMIIGITGGSGKTFLTNCIINGQLSAKDPETPLIIVFDFKNEYPHSGFNYDCIKLDNEGIHGEEYQIKLNPKFFSAALWSIFFDKHNVRLKSDLDRVVAEMEEQEKIININNLYEYFNEYVKDVGTNKQEKRRVGRFLEKSFPMDKWIDTDDDGFRKYLVDPNTKCIILDLNREAKFGEAVGHYIFHQIDELKELAKFYVDIYRDFKKNEEGTEEEIKKMARDKFRLSKKVVSKLEKYGINEDKLHTYMKQVFNRKIVYVIDEAGDKEFGLLRQGVNKNVLRKLSIIATRQRYHNINFILIGQYPTQILPEFRSQCAHKLIGRLEDAAAAKTLADATDTTPTEVLSRMSLLSRGQFFSYIEGDKKFIEVTPPWEKDYMTTWASNKIHHLIEV